MEENRPPRQTGQVLTALPDQRSEITSPMKSILLKVRYALSQRQTSPRDYLYAEEADTMHIDGKTYDLIELDRLSRCMDTTKTLAGRITQSHTLANPSTNTDHIAARQAATAEIIENPALRSGLEDVVAAAARYQGDFHRLLFGRFIGLLSDPSTRLEHQGYGYSSYRYGIRFLPSIIEKIDELPETRSSYLTAVITKLKDFKSTSSYELLTAPVYLLPGRIMPKSNRKLLSFRFKSSPFKLSIILLLAFLFYSIPVYLQLNPMSASMTLSLMFLLVLLYLPIVGSLDRDHVIYPFRKSLLKAGEVEDAVRSLGQLDELLSFYRYHASNEGKTCIPEVRDTGRCIINLEQVRHPALGFNNEEYTANDFDNGGKPLVFISGPNSGGKTALCKTLALTQVMAQSGGVILALSGRLGVADRICYQAPDPGSILEDEGRFGTELRRTREIFLNTTRKSLVILDELSEGTSHQEETKIAAMILDGFTRLGNTTILVSHNNDLAHLLKDRGTGIFYKFYLEDGAPAFILAEGISESSHAELVAERIGFSQKDIDRHLDTLGV